MSAAEGDAHHSLTYASRLSAHGDIHTFEEELSAMTENGDYVCRMSVSSVHKVLNALTNGPVARLYDREDGCSRFFLTLYEGNAANDAFNSIIQAIRARSDWELEACDACNHSPDFKFLVAVKNDPLEAENSLRTIIASEQK